jgi:hypothetical protein
MDVYTVRADNVLQIAQTFRSQAAETSDLIYHHMMLRTAAELEELAETLLGRRCFEPDKSDYVS